MKTNSSLMTRERFDGFSGMDISSPLGKSYCRPENFRVLSDGSLEKREGFFRVAKFSEAVRGVCGFRDGSQEVILAAVGRSLWRILPSGECDSAEVFESESGVLRFFLYRGALYLHDGMALYRYEGGLAVSSVQGYAPLYGKNWDAYLYWNNRENEPINPLTRRIRLHYRVGREVELIHLGFEVERVVSVEFDGVLLDSATYELSEDRLWLRLADMPYADEVRIAVVMAENPYAKDFFACTECGVYDDFEYSRLFFYGGEDTSVYISVNLSDEMKKGDKKAFADSDGLYFTEKSRLELGGMGTPKAIKRLYDRVLLVFENAIWVSEPMEEARERIPSFKPICQHLGCSSRGCFLVTGASRPVTVTLGGIYRLKIDTDFEDECLVEGISAPISASLSPGFAENALLCHHRRRAELWFSDGEHGDGGIWIYQLDRGCWYHFSALPSRGLFEMAGGVGFYTQDSIFLFDEALLFDVLGEERCEIEATLTCCLLGLSEPSAAKHLVGVSVLAEPCGSPPALSIADGEELSFVRLTDADEAAIGSHVYTTGLRTDRFYTARPRLLCAGAGRQRIYAIEFILQKGTT